MNLSSELQVVSRVDEGTDVDGETTETKRHLLQDVDDVVHIRSPLEIEGVTSIDVDPSAREGLDDFLDSGGKCNLGHFLDIRKGYFNNYFTNKERRLGKSSNEDI